MQARCSLDEVGEIPLDLQGKLLRVIQEGRFERVGEETTRQVDFRIVAATNRDLRAEVAAGRFRRDLFYRLSVFPIQLPPLRERPEDIPRLAIHFLQQAARRHGRSTPRLTAQAARTLETYRWPGNVRELQHVIERAVLLARGDVLRLDGTLGDAAEEPPRGETGVREPAPTVVSDREWRRREAENIRAALRLAGGRIYGPDGAADRLGVKPTTLISRLKALGLRDQRSRRRQPSG